MPFGPFLPPGEPDPYAGVSRLLSPWMIPSWVGRAPGWYVAWSQAWGAEIDTLSDQLIRIGLQRWIRYASFALDEWDAQSGLSVESGWTIAQRRTRLIAHFLSLRGPVGRAMQEIVRSVVGNVALPSIYIGPFKWDVFKLAERGWPGDSAFQEAQRRIGRVGPAAFGNWVAAWDDLGGLTFEQIDQMAFEATDVLTFEEVNGS